jgi:hypothetical protein
MLLTNKKRQPLSLPALPSSMQMHFAAPLAPPGFHWTCVGYAFLPRTEVAAAATEATLPVQPLKSAVCRATLKASDGKRRECAHRACFDLAERNVRLWATLMIGPARLAELSEDLRSYCGTAHLYQLNPLCRPAIYGLCCQGRYSKTQKNTELLSKHG